MSHSSYCLPLSLRKVWGGVCRTSREVFVKSVTWRQKERKGSYRTDMKKRYLSYKTGKNTHETLLLLSPDSCCDASQLFSFSLSPFVNLINFSFCIFLPSPFSTWILEYIDLVSVIVNTASPALFLFSFNNVSKSCMTVPVCSRLQQLQDSLEQACRERIQYEAEFKVSPCNEVIMNKWTALKWDLLKSSICNTLQQKLRNNRTVSSWARTSSDVWFLWTLSSPLK